MASENIALILKNRTEMWRVQSLLRHSLEEGLTLDLELRPVPEDRNESEMVDTDSDGRTWNDLYVMFFLLFSLHEELLYRLHETA